jgi:hypothetical protein
LYRTALAIGKISPPVICVSHQFLLCMCRCIGSLHGQQGIYEPQTATIHSNRVCHQQQ